ncbi:MAG TPA: MaoC/PaaZ C-terminal domain-containing protein [Gemmataceae bacterium]|jgi:acyl dehydratase|nr:MaoC/PaaZ C-terminal domain-containing protein [Gemmataceae bacterium]
MTFTSLHLFFDDVEVGQFWESPGRTVTETDIVSFAGLSGDFNPIHTDHEFAKTTPFRRPIAHGLLAWAISSGLGLYSPAMRTLAFLSIREWHFKAPIFIGDTIRLRSEVLEKESRARGRRGIITWQRQIINQEGKVVQEGVISTLIEGRAGAKGEPGTTPLEQEEQAEDCSP